MTVNDKRVLVVGGNGHIGASVAAAFRLHGAKVAVADSSVTAVTTDTIRMDVTDAKDVATAVRTATERLGGTVEVLINAVGLAVEAPFTETSDETWRETIEVNLLGVVNACKAVTPGMVDASWGRIINLASQIGIKGGAGLSAYAASKGGVIALTRSMALELAEFNVLVNAIAPGPIRSPMIDRTSHQWQAKKLSELPLGRFGNAEEVAPTALLLADDPGGNLFVGQTLSPDCGDAMH